jgi:Ca2+-transporting ATPase
MVFKGTSVVSGQGRAVAVATSYSTEIGQIQQLAGSARAPETQLQRQLDHLGAQLAWVSLGACGLTFGLGLLRGYGLLEMMKGAVSLAVAAVPEGLPTVATVTLAIGIRQMRQRHVLVRKLPAVETLGSVAAVCFDKTGTLTENAMKASVVVLGQSKFTLSGPVEGEASKTALENEPTLRELLKVCVLCSEATAENGDADNWRLLGSGTETALLRLALDFGVNVADLRLTHPLLETTYRSDGRNYMTTRHMGPEGRCLVTIKGSPDEVLGLCTSHMDGGLVRPLDKATRNRLEQGNAHLGAEGLRVLGFASGTAKNLKEPAELCWLGLVGLADPIRPHMDELMQVFHGAGVRTVLITGDQTATAYAIAKTLDLSQGEPVEILEGTELDKLDPKLLSALARHTHVFARVSPANKLQIVRALQSDGQAVAMTGDGINDSPALRAADIGVALGSGTEMAHEVSDVVLSDDRLETMAVALAQGRATYDNIRKAIHFLISTNLGEILVMLAATGLRLGQPLSPMQLLWINLVTDVFPALALAVDAPDPRVLKVPPRGAGKTVIGRMDLERMAVEGSVITACSLASYLVGRTRYGTGPEAAGMGFTTLTVSQLLHAISGRSASHTIFDWPPLPPNSSLRIAVGGLLWLQAAVSMLPPTRRLLGLGNLGSMDLAIAAGTSVLSFLGNEAIKISLRERAGVEPANFEEKEA